MDNVQFDEEKVNNQFFRKNKTNNGLIGLVIKAGLAKNEVQANIVLIIVALLCIAGTVFVIIQNVSSNKTTTPTTTGQKVYTTQQLIDLMKK